MRNDTNKHGINVRAHSRKRRFHYRNMCRTTAQQRKDIAKQVYRKLQDPKVPVVFYRIRKGREVSEVSERDVDIFTLQMDGYRIVDQWREWL